MSITILCISDLHAFNFEELAAIGNMDYNACFLLGDIPQPALLAIKEANGNRPLYGVCGNHDNWQSLEYAGIEDIHCRAVQVGEYAFAGIGGSSRYKNGDYAMMTQPESLKVSRNCPAADILISHDCAYNLFGTGKAHQGLWGISWYLFRKKPRMNLCGHYHKEQRAKWRSCEVQCIYRFALIHLPDKTQI